MFSLEKIWDIIVCKCDYFGLFALLWNPTGFLFNLYDYVALIISLMFDFTKHCIKFVIGS